MQKFDTPDAVILAALVLAIIALAYLAAAPVTL